jgi:AraC-like DNA-binding protein
LALALPQTIVGDSNPDRIFFDSDALPERDRFPAYCEEMIRRYAAVDVVVRDKPRFRGVIELQRVGAVNIGRITSTPGEYIRSSSFVRDGDDAFCVILLRNGGAVLTQFDNLQTVKAGEGIVCDNGYFGALDFASACQLWNLKIPRSRITNLVPGLDLRAGAKLARDPAALQLLFGYVSGAHGVDLTGGGPAARLYDEHIIDLIALALGAEGDQRVLVEGRGVRAARLAAILQAISTQISNPDLSATTIAAQQGITPRYVHLLLEQSGQTFTQHVLQMRLEKARELLGGDDGQDRRVADIALEAGFADLSHFNRAFRRHFGDTPSGVRASGGKRRP